MIGNELLQSYLSLLFPTNSSCYQSCIIGAIYFYRYTRPTSHVSSGEPVGQEALRWRPHTACLWPRAWSVARLFELEQFDQCGSAEWRLSSLASRRLQPMFYFRNRIKTRTTTPYRARSIRITPWQVAVRVANRNPFLVRGWMLIILRFASGLVLRDIIVALRFVIN